MSRLEEIEAAIAKLPPHEVEQLSQWLSELQAERWNEQIERDAQSGRLDKVAVRARDDVAEYAGQARHRLLERCRQSDWRSSDPYPTRDQLHERA